MELLPIIDLHSEQLASTLIKTCLFECLNGFLKRVEIFFITIYEKRPKLKINSFLTCFSFRAEENVFRVQNLDMSSLCVFKRFSKTHSTHVRVLKNINTFTSKTNKYKCIPFCSGRFSVAERNNTSSFLPRMLGSSKGVHDSFIFTYTCV